MKSTTFCVSKQVLFISIISILLIGVPLFISSFGNNTISSNTRASSPKQRDCSADVPGGVAGRVYFVDGGKWYKDPNGVYEIPALGVYCTENLETSTRCRDVRMDHGNCKKPLYQIGSIEIFYTNSSCQGAIMGYSSAPMTSREIEGDYCNGTMPYYLAYKCPGTDGPFSMYLPPESGQYTDNFGNYCKLMSGTPVPGFELFGANCQYFGFGLGARTDRVLFKELLSRFDNPLFYYDPYGLYNDSSYPNTPGFASEYCHDDKVKSLDEFLAKRPAKVDCTKFVKGGLATAHLRFAGNKTYYSGDLGFESLKLLTPQDVCRGTIRTSTCYNYATLTGMTSKQPDKQFKTADEISFSTQDGTPIASIISYCQLEQAKKKDGALKFNTLY